MTHPKSFALILEEFRQRATGKDPFGPCTDLETFFESLEQSQRPEFLSYLSTLERDDFWSDHIAWFKRGRKTTFVASPDGEIRPV